MSTAPHARLDPAQLETFLALRDTAVAHAVDACAQANPALFARFGARGRSACSEDIRYHIDYLTPALEHGDPTPFLSYLGWLAQVLRARGVPAASLPQSLRDLATFYRQHLPPDTAATVAAVLEAGHAHLADAPAPPDYSQPSPAAWPECDPFQQAVLASERHRAQQLFDAAMAQDTSLVSAEIHVIQPALYAIGREWQANRVTVAQEHLATAMAQFVMANAYGRATPAPDNGGRALLACPPGNHHEVGLRMLADALEMDGWSVQCLGANTPTAALAAQAEHFAPHLICLSASLPQHLRRLRETINMVRQQLGACCPPIAIGGLVVNQFPALLHTLPAVTLGTDAEAAALAARAYLPDGR